MDAVLQHFLQQPVVAAATHHAPSIVLPVATFVAEVVRLVDHDQVEGAPVELGQVDRVRPALVPAQVRVGQHGVAEPVLDQRVVVVPRPRRVADPVLLQLLGAEHQHALVAHLEELDDCQGRPRLPQPHAVGEDASIVLEQPVDGAHGAVLLKAVERPPNGRVVQMNVLHKSVSVPPLVDPVLQGVKERLVVDELGRVVLAQALQRRQHFLFRISSEPLVVPEGVEPLNQPGPVGAVANLQVELDVGVGAEAQAAPREVGAAHKCTGAAVGVLDMIHLAVQKVGLAHGAHVHLLLDPISARTGKRLLRQCAAQLQGAVASQAVGLVLSLRRVHRRRARRLAVEEAKAPESLQLGPQVAIGVDREVGRHGGERGVGPEAAP